VYDHAGKKKEDKLVDSRGRRNASRKRERKGTHPCVPYGNNFL